jgi:aminopeptidase-like protein
MNICPCHLHSDSFLWGSVLCHPSCMKGHLSCFSVLTTLGKEIENIVVQDFDEQKFSYLWDKCSGMKFLGNVLIT